MGIKLRFDEKLSADEVKKIVDELYREVAERWEERVNRTPFMTLLREGKLPLKVLQIFFRNWGAYTIEINTLAACSYRRHLPFFKTHRELMASRGEKIAVKFIHPKPPGHFLVMLQTARAFGLSEEEVFERSTDGIEYCATTSVDLHGDMLRAGLEAAEGKK